MNPNDESALLEQAAQALRAHSLIVSVDAERLSATHGRSNALLRVSQGRCRVDYAAAVKRRLTPSTLGAVVTQLRQPADAGGPQLLLLTDYVTLPLANQLRAREQPFADAAGNAYLEGGGLFVYVTGRKLDHKQIALRASKGFTTSRLKVLFALLCDPPLAAAPYRAIAAAADVALGVMTTVLADLQQDGSLVVVDRQRRLKASKRLLDEWAQAYALGLRGKTLIGRFLAEHFAAWPDWQLNPAHARWGGEPAAALLGCDPLPGMLTIYGDKLPARLIAHEHLEVAGPVAYEHLVELRKPFWGQTLSAVGRPDLVAPVLIYADLLATGNTRCIEAAQMIYDAHLARLFPVV